MCPTLSCQAAREVYPLSIPRVIPPPCSDAAAERGTSSLSTFQGVRSASWFFCFFFGLFVKLRLNNTPTGFEFPLTPLR